MKSPPTRDVVCKRCFSNSNPYFTCNFSNNMSIFQARVNISKPGHDTTFRQCLTKTFGFIVFRLSENAFVKFSLPLHDTIISPPMQKNPSKVCPKRLVPPRKAAFGEKSSHTLGKEIVSQKMQDQQHNIFISRFFQHIQVIIKNTR